MTTNRNCDSDAFNADDLNADNGGAPDIAFSTMMRKRFTAIISDNHAPFSDEILTEMVQCAWHGCMVYPCRSGGYVFGDGTGLLQYCNDFEELKVLAVKSRVHK